MFSNLNLPNQDRGGDAIVQSFAEKLGKGEKEAAKLVLLGTILSVVTLPVASLLLPLLA